mmetsp:Transcript_16076/g.29852  ORF Transcript_16076/g.29852 Transcript_16076/m.29852 type:complete len:152 (-) Transcript_16076:912-1367(-)
MGYKLAVCDGRTTVMDLELGAAGTFVDQWYKKREGKSYINFGTGVSHELARAIVLDGHENELGDAMDARSTRTKSGWSMTHPTLEQGNKIMEVMDAGLREGGISVCSTLGYMRYGVSAREVFEMQKLGAAYGRPAAAHVRYTPCSCSLAPV